MTILTMDRKELEKKVTEIVGKACIRAKANGRNTVMGKDIGAYLNTKLII